MSVLSVGLSTTHSLAKSPTSYIYLLTNQGVQSDVHCSPTPSSNPRQCVPSRFVPNPPSFLNASHPIPSHLTNHSLPLSRVSLLDSSLLTTLSASTPLSPGSLGENITTSNLDLTSLPLHTLLHFGDHDGHAVVRITGTREPRKRAAEWPTGLRERERGSRKQKVGVMGVVVRDGYVQPGDVVFVEKGKGGKLGSV
ncbi:hypothetical protein LHYA1_G004577 [Lachnellula hyalina]|uniref:MOSC domain-containing protein n=1 Tax=Lachnellula hyalina TaxID=1316788 RepID=A0A8H8R1N9_9HELO|nr:uncharacterized protein LHYA1_G004577 [Lachnellula hyalina]TVY25800.1 hypothetical protein LHYA1_G004577 [Lachnellula hyalina]